MVSFQLGSSTLNGSWLSCSQGWRNQESYIYPFSHPALETITYFAPNQALFITRERSQLSPAAASLRSSDSQPATYCSASQLQTALELARQWLLDYLIIFINGEQSQSVHLYAGQLGTAPVYLLQHKNVLHGHWQLLALYKYFQSRTLNVDQTAHSLLTFGYPYAQQTIFPDVHLLTERSQANWLINASGAHELQRQYPEPVNLYQPKRLKPGADVVMEFQRLLAETIRQYIYSENVVASELSGGLDSAMVSVSLARQLNEPVRTIGLIMPGTMGVAQQNRRLALIDRFQFIDANLNAADYPPLSADHPDVLKNYTQAGMEVYGYAMERMFSMVSTQGCSLVFTGSGGDELMYSHWSEMTEMEQALFTQNIVKEQNDIAPFFTAKTLSIYRDTLLSIDRAPVGYIPGSMVDASRSASPLYLQQGLWPVSPLHAPDLVKFCRQLPLAWRDDRFLTRQYLHDCGCSSEITRPVSQESFLPVLEHALLHSGRTLLQHLYRQSRLAELGLVDSNKLQKAYGHYCQTGQSPYVEAFYSIAILELTLRAIEDASVMVPSAYKNS